MANINIENISDLALNGNALFEDSESFMTELNVDDEQKAIMGGFLCETYTCQSFTAGGCTEATTGY